MGVGGMPVHAREKGNGKKYTNRQIMQQLLHRTSNIIRRALDGIARFLESIAFGWEGEERGCHTALIIF